MAKPATPLAEHPDILAEQFCYLTTTGRKSKLPRTVELWWAGEGDKVYFVSGGGLESDWVKNLRREPRVVVTIDGLKFPGEARTLDPLRDREAWTRGAELCSRKYYRRDASYLGRGWAREAVVVEVRLTGPGTRARG